MDAAVPLSDATEELLVTWLVGWSREGEAGVAAWEVVGVGVGVDVVGSALSRTPVMLAKPSSSAAVDAVEVILLQWAGALVASCARWLGPG
jgi:hypothetical protein